MISMIASTMPAAIRPYSIAVAPDYSSAANSAHLHLNFTRVSFPTLPGIAGAGDLHNHNPRLSKLDRLKLTTMNAAFAGLFGRGALGTAMEPALPLRNTCPKSPLSPNCAIAPPHRPPNN
ncbi:hypothetical protein ACVWW2_004400 [Bradyrhizobium sp. LM4.3]